MQPQIETNMCWLIMVVFAHLCIRAYEVVDFPSNDIQHETQKADKDDFPIFDNISFFGPNNLFDLKNLFNVHKLAKLE
jgi:hypothetical protein